MPPVGNTVDLKQATYANTIGSAELMARGPIPTSIRPDTPSTTSVCSRYRRRGGRLTTPSGTSWSFCLTYRRRSRSGRGPHRSGNALMQHTIWPSGKRGSCDYHTARCPAGIGAVCAPAVGLAQDAGKPVVDKRQYRRTRSKRLRTACSSATRTCTRRTRRMQDWRATRSAPMRHTDSRKARRWCPAPAYRPACDSRSISWWLRTIPRISACPSPITRDDPRLLASDWGRLIRDEARKGTIEGMTAAYTMWMSRVIALQDPLADRQDMRATMSGTS